jgi:hypothetical protein
MNRIIFVCICVIRNFIKIFYEMVFYEMTWRLKKWLDFLVADNGRYF